MNNLDKILDALIAESEEKIRAVREKSAEECARVKAECDDAILAMQNENGEKLRREREMILSRAKSSGEMRHREIMLGARVGLLDKAYADAEKFIYEMDRDIYRGLLSRLLCDAVCDRAAEERALAQSGEETFGLEFTVHMNKADLAELGEEIIAEALVLIKERGESAPALTLCKTPCNIKGGLILRGRDVETDCTVSAIMKAHRSRTEAETAKVLFS